MMLHLQLVCIMISIFFSQLQYTCVSFKIPCQYMFCLIYFDQRHSREFNSFKIKMFTNILRDTFCLYLVKRTCKYWIKKGWGIDTMGCIRDKPSSSKSKTCYLATYLSCQSTCQISVSRWDWWTGQKPMCTET